MVTVVPIVEGHGDVQAVPVLIRRIAAHCRYQTPNVLRPVRVPRQKLVKPGEFERAVQLAMLKGGPDGGILVLVDAEDDCPAQLGPSFVLRAKAVRRNVPIAVVLAKHEFEAWFLAAAESLRGKRRLPPDSTGPPDPEAVSDAKGWLSSKMHANDSYRETLDQPALTAMFNLDAARRADSFDKCYREVVALLDLLKNPQVRT